MQKNPGYVYVLFNPSAEGLVKIGKTTKDPEERARELSSGTGVPTPFIVVYKAFFEDCSAAETFIHTLLHDKRISNNKEFYRVSNTEAIHAILETERKFNKNSVGESRDESGQLVGNSLEKQKASNEIWQELMDRADEYYYGFGDTLQDYEEARNYYQKAATLGCSEAYLKLGDMYQYGEGGNIDIKKAVNFYKLGA